MRFVQGHYASDVRVLFKKDPQTYVEEGACCFRRYAGTYEINYSQTSGLLISTNNPGKA